MPLNPSLHKSKFVLRSWWRFVLQVTTCQNLHLQQKLRYGSCAILIYERGIQLAIAVLKWVRYAILTESFLLIAKP